MTAVLPTSPGNSSSDDGSSSPVDDYKFVRKALRFADVLSTRAEFAALDYTPLTNIKPVDLTATLRPTKLGRKIRLFVCVTCYNEEGEELRRTLSGLAANYPYLERAGLHWSEIAVCVVVDGLDRAAPSLLDFCASELHIYDASLLRSSHLREPVSLHLFERTVELPRHETQRDYHFPMQLALAFKPRNGGKLHSHLWFFTGFAAQLNPKYCALVDVGTEPGPSALAKLYAAMEDDPQCGGSSGELRVRGARFTNMLEAVQTFEYAAAHVMDKALESACGFINVLPGAFSMYRWVAVRGDPLAAYFTIEEIPAKDLGPARANMYLAEDRVLCFEIVAKRHRAWLLRYVAGAVAHTDAPATLIALIKQRRRWINGSFFALLYYLLHFPRVLTANHAPLRKAVLAAQWGFQLSTIFFAWFAVSNMFLTLLLIYGQAASRSPWLGYEMRIIFIIAYCVVLFMQLVVGLAGPVAQSAAPFYLTVATLFAIAMFFSVAIAAWLLSASGLTWLIGLGMACSIFAYTAAAALHGQLFHVALVTLQYVSFLPVYVNVFTVYSLCNTHDVSWGSREGGVQTRLTARHGISAQRARAKAARATADIAAMGVEVAVEAELGARSSAVAGSRLISEHRIVPAAATAEAPGVALGSPGGGRHSSSPHVDLPAHDQRSRAHHTHLRPASAASHLPSQARSQGQELLRPATKDSTRELGLDGRPLEVASPLASLPSSMPNASPVLPRGLAARTLSLPPPRKAAPAAPPSHVGASAASGSAPGCSTQQPGDHEVRAARDEGASSKLAAVEVRSPCSNSGGAGSAYAHSSDAESCATCSSAAVDDFEPSSAHYVQKVLESSGSSSGDLGAVVALSADSPQVSTDASSTQSSSAGDEEFPGASIDSARGGWVAAVRKQGRTLPVPPAVTALQEAAPVDGVLLRAKSAVFANTLARNAPVLARPASLRQLAAQSRLHLLGSAATREYGFTSDAGTPRVSHTAAVGDLHRPGQAQHPSAAANSSGLPSAAHMKFIAAESPGQVSAGEAAEEGAPAACYVAYSDDWGLRDRGLELPVEQHAEVAAALSAPIDEAALRRERVARLRRELAAQSARGDCEARLVEQAAQDARDTALAFNLFRIKMTLAFFISNLILVGLVLAYDPALSNYALGVTLTVVFQSCVKLIGSCVFQLARLGRACLRRCCLSCCYRVERDPAGHPRLVCVLRPSSFWALDDLHEAENAYKHCYPEDYDAAEERAVDLENRIAKHGFVPTSLHEQGRAPLPSSLRPIRARSSPAIAAPRGHSHSTGFRRAQKSGRLASPPLSLSVREVGSSDSDELLEVGRRPFSTVQRLTGAQSPDRGSQSTATRPVATANSSSSGGGREARAVWQLRRRGAWEQPEPESTKATSADGARAPHIQSLSLPQPSDSYGDHGAVAADAEDIEQHSTVFGQFAADFAHRWVVAETAGPTKNAGGSVAPLGAQACASPHALLRPPTPGDDSRSLPPPGSVLSPQYDLQWLPAIAEGGSGESGSGENGSGGSGTSQGLSAPHAAANPGGASPHIQQHSTSPSADPPHMLSGMQLVKAMLPRSVSHQGGRSAAAEPSGEGGGVATAEANVPQRRQGDSSSSGSTAGSHHSMKPSSAAPEQLVRVQHAPPLEFASSGDGSDSVVGGTSGIVGHWSRRLARGIGVKLAVPVSPGKSIPLVAR